MEILLLGIVAFVGIHSVSIINPGWRDHMVSRMGLLPWQGIYALIALGGFALIIWGYGIARQTPMVLYIPPIGLRHLILLLMAPVFPLLLAAYLPGRIQKTTKHPMLLATMLWAFCHLLSNGMLADLILFGAFLLWAMADYLSFQRRPPQTIPGAPASAMNDLIAVVGGLALYAAFIFWLHARFLGVALL